MDGMGDSFEFLCRFVKLHGARAIIFLDGDKRARVDQLKVSENHRDVPVVFLPGNSEFEDLVPAGVYLRALFQLTAIESPADVDQQLASWTAEVQFRMRQAFSKRVEKWFTDHFDADFPPKKVLMAKAIELAEVDEINAEPISELLGKIEAALSSSSFT